MSERLTEEQFTSIKRRVNSRDEALAGIDHVAPVHVARDANNDANVLITALRAERAAHQATRAELEKYHRYLEIGDEDPRVDAARAGQETDDE